MPNIPTKPANTNGAPTRDPAALTGLLTIIQLSDSALPTGSFSHSFGLETYLQRGAVHNAETYTAWATGYLHQVAYSEGLAVRLATEAATVADHAQLARVDQLLYATAIPRQVREAGISMGQRMNTIVEVAIPDTPALQQYRAAIDDGACYGHPSVVFALAASAVGVSMDETIAAYLMQLVTGLTQNAIRAIPLGQNAGQQVLSTLRGVVPEVVSVINSLDEHDLGANAPGLEIAQMMHETQRARMFMS